MCSDSAEYIKASVIDWLLSHHNDIIIGNEIMYGTMRKVVDLMAIINNKTIAIEIKGAADNLARLPEQLEEYNKVFDKVMVVAAPSHIEGIAQILPHGTGLFVSQNSTIKKLNSPLVNHKQDKLEMLYSVSSVYLKKQNPQYRSLNENEIRLLLSKKKKADIQQLLVSFYKQRLAEKFLLFMSERGENTLVDDIPTLSTFMFVDES